MMQRDVIPVVDVSLSQLHLFQHLLGIIDEGAEFTLVLVAQGVSEEFVHLALDIS